MWAMEQLRLLKGSWLWELTAVVQIGKTQQISKRSWSVWKYLYALWTGKILREVWMCSEALLLSACILFRGFLLTMGSICSISLTCSTLLTSLNNYLYSMTSIRFHPSLFNLIDNNWFLIHNIFDLIFCYYFPVLPMDAEIRKHLQLPKYTWRNHPNTWWWKPLITKTQTLPRLKT